ncbi:MAG TPA: hypothetical protein PKX06_08905 [Phenylobacterium sp.]|nr:hypothetical protein [Phenylobacterium sp.]
MDHKVHGAASFLGQRYDVDPLDKSPNFIDKSALGWGLACDAVSQRILKLADHCRVGLGGAGMQFEGRLLVCELRQLGLDALRFPLQFHQPGFHGRVGDPALDCRNDSTGAASRLGKASLQWRFS